MRERAMAVPARMRRFGTAAAATAAMPPFNQL
jgi:hypothetical protein